MSSDTRSRRREGVFTISLIRKNTHTGQNLLFGFRCWRSLKASALACIFSLTFSQFALAESITRAAEFNLPGLHQPIKLSDFRGRLVYLDFWASWCKPCLQSFPWMEEIQRKYREQGLTVIAVNLDRDREQAEKFIAKYTPSFRIAFDTVATTPTQYGVQGMPTSFLIARDGRILSTHIGFNNQKKDHYEQLITQALNFDSN